MHAAKQLDDKTYISRSSGLNVWTAPSVTLIRSLALLYIHAYTNTESRCRSPAEHLDLYAIQVDNRYATAIHRQTSYLATVKWKSLVRFSFVSCEVIQYRQTESLISGIHCHAILLTLQHYQHSNDGCKIMIFLLGFLSSFFRVWFYVVSCLIFYFILCTICVFYISWRVFRDAVHTPTLSLIGMTVAWTMYVLSSQQDSIRAFCVAGPVDWNSLPLHIRSAPTLSPFKNMLKTPFLTFLLYWLTVSRVLAANIVVGVFRGGPRPPHRTKFLLCLSIA